MFGLKIGVIFEGNDDWYVEIESMNFKGKLFQIHLVIACCASSHEQKKERKYIGLEPN